MYIKNAKVFFIKGILMMILTFRDELSTRIRIRDFYFRSDPDPDPGKNFPDPKPWKLPISAKLTKYLRTDRLQQRRNFRNKVLSHFGVVLHFTLNFTLLCKTTLEFTPILLHSECSFTLTFNRTGSSTSVVAETGYLPV